MTLHCHLCRAVLYCPEVMVSTRTATAYPSENMYIGGGDDRLRYEGYTLRWITLLGAKIVSIWWRLCRPMRLCDYAIEG